MYKRQAFTFAIFVPLGFLDEVFVGFFVAAASSSGAVVGFALAVTDGVLVGFTVAVAFGVAVGCFVEMCIRDRYFVGQNLEKNSEIELTVENNKKTWYGVKENAAYSGYDLSKPGKQTVTVRYMGLETTYDIEVLKMDHIKVVPSENTTYPVSYTHLTVTVVL